MNVLFRQNYGWALLPYKLRVDQTTIAEDAEMYAKYFRWVRRWRVPELCWPWRMSQEVGWIVPSPVDVRVTPVVSRDVCVPPAERNVFTQMSGMVEIQESEDTQAMFAGERENWLKIYQVEFQNAYDSMFALESSGFVSWRLGWDIVLPPDRFAMFVPLPDWQDVEIAPDVLDQNTLQSCSQEFGVCLSIRPRRAVEIYRRQPLARLLILSKEDLEATAQGIDSDGNPILIQERLVER